ncbi:MAG TPA: M20/M25/M40 family metallo-hydrolase [Gemmatimonadaceae bacterium]|nr:M20/M25/M40 family metallo-hydrolase [Gemmatimonadaceae bacterium]
METQVAVAQIAAPTGDESDRARWVAERFETLGLADVDIDSAGNVAARRPGLRESGPVVVCAHLDTVFPRSTEHSVRQSGSRFTGPSITDNSRGIAAMLALADVMRGLSWLNRPVEFVGSTGEEGAGDLRGSKHYFATRGADAIAAVMIDGAGDERIVHRALGSRRFRVSFDGPGGHSWSAFGAANAVHAAARAASAIAGLPLPRTPRTTVTVSRIGGGLSVNSIPQHAWIEIDVRSSSAPVLATMSHRIAEAVHDATAIENQRSTPGTDALRARVITIGDRPCGETPEHHPLVEAAVATTRLLHRGPDLAMASTDANVPISLGIPAIAIGAGGRGGDTHSTGEWFDNVDGMVGIARALTIIATAASE